MLKRTRRRRPKTLQNVIKKELRCNRRNIYIGDKHLDPIPDKDMHAFLAYDHTENGNYCKEIWDCDNFSLQFAAAAQRYFAPKGINAAIGIIWTAKHAFNLSVNQDYKVVLWEPQSDSRCFLDGCVKLVMM